MNQSSTIQPKIEVLTQEDIQRIHEDSLRILSQTGVRIESERALGLLAKREGVDVSGD